MCPKCGSSSTFCNCFNSDPFCSTCFKETDCDVKYNAKCVVYNYNDPHAINKLTCLGLPNGVSVHTFMERVDQEFCYLKSCEFVDYILSKIDTCVGLKDKLCDLTCDCDCNGHCTAAYIISGGTLPNAVTGSAYTHTITLGGTAPFTLQNISKPSWLTLTVSGNQIQFTGTPITAGTVAVTFDIHNCSDSYIFNYVGSITIANSCIAPFTISSNLPDAIENQAYSGEFVFGGTQTLTINVISKPSWMTITFTDHIHALMSGTPGTGDVTDATPVHFTITNSCGTLDISEFINIYAENGACFPPSGLNVVGTTVGSNANFSVTWSNVIGVTDQELWYGKSLDIGLTHPPAVGWTQVSGITGTTNGATVNGLDTNTEYIFSVRSNCGILSSNWVNKKAYSLECPIMTLTSNNGTINYSLDINHYDYVQSLLSQITVILRDPSNGNPSTCIAKQEIFPAYSSPTTGSFTGLTPTHGYEVGLVFSVGAVPTCCPTCDDPVTFCTLKNVSTTSGISICPNCTLSSGDVTISNVSDIGFTVSVTGLSGTCQSSYDLVITEGVTVIASLTGLIGPYVFNGGNAATTYTVTVVKKCCCNNTYSDPVSLTGNTTSFAGSTCAWINNTTPAYTASAVMHTLTSATSFADITISPLPSGGSLTLTNGMVIAKCNTNCCVLDCFDILITGRKLSTDARFQVVYNPSSGYNYQITYSGPNTTITGDTNFTANFSCV